IVALLTSMLLAFPAVASAGAVGITILAPIQGQVVGPTVTISVGTVGSVTAVSFEVATGADPTWIPIAVDTDPSDGWGSSWDAQGVDGPATIRAAATDGSQTAAASVGVVVHTAAPALGVALSRTAFSPNRDRAAEWTVVNVTVEEGLALALDVIDLDGKVRRRLTDEGIPAGTTSVRWNGTSGTGHILTDGRYEVRATVVDELGNAAVAAAPVILDTERPRLRWDGVRPDPYLGTGGVRFSIRASDRSPELVVRAIVRDAVDRVAKRYDALAFAGGELAFEWNGRNERGRPTEPGLHTAEVLVRDDAGNVATTGRQPFRNHRPVHAVVTRWSEGAGRRVALTFDDCWNADAWDRILDVLRAKHAGASFFCLGSSVEGHPSLARRTVAAGHTIGSHGSDHSNVASLSPGEIEARVRSDVRAWWDVARVTPIPYFRPPFGLFDTEAQLALGQQGIRYLVLWDVDPWDWSSPGSSVVTQRVMSDVHRGSIVVLHAIDGTARALPGLIDRLRARKLEPVTLEELLHR
ncbi:MAG TPA: polysaccharide deacetylase family protein, partial [Actinomycetota bacterium]|nr:polysaccharide deacetylase family protein [Actinomycetota bacterium]